MALKSFPIRWCCFRGRASRAEFVWNLFAYALMLPLFYVVMAVLGSMMPLLSLAGGAAILAVWLTWVGVSVRRLKDCGRSLWWVAVPLLPSLLQTGEELLLRYCRDDAWATELLDHPAWHVLWAISVLGALLFLLYLLIKKGTPGPNRYGPDPLISAEALAGKPAISHGLSHREGLEQ